MIGMKKRPVIISVGGSLIVPNGGINVEFLTKLNHFVREYVKKGERFFLVAGGGATARGYIDAGSAVIGNLTEEDLDWLGIHSTRLNAHLLRTVFMDIAHPRTVENYSRRLINWREPVVIGAGWKPGWSTDYDAVILARDYKARLIINLSDIDWVYDKDPNKYSHAKPIKRMTWTQLQDLIGTKWMPGFKAPFDPMAVKLANQIGITAVITNGNDFDNLEKIMEGDVFKGTVVMPFKLDASFYDRQYYLGKKGGLRYGYAESLRGKIVYTLANLYRALIIKLFIKPQTCLDVGCGTGYLVKWLRFFGIDAYGVEISQDALNLAKPSIKPFLKKGDILDLPYKDGEFDLVLTYDVLEHLERSKIPQAIKETVRVSKKWILHKIYTNENSWLIIFHGIDFAHLSVFPTKYWEQLFRGLKEVRLVRGNFLKLPAFFESVFLLKKS